MAGLLEPAFPRKPQSVIEGRRKWEDCRVSGPGRPGFWYNATASRAEVDFSDSRRRRVALGSRKGAVFTCRIPASSR